MFEELHPSRPDDLAAVVNGPIRFATFFPLQAAVKAKCVEVAGNVPVPSHLKSCPLFRAAGYINPATHRVEDCWLWDGDKEWRIGKLTEEQLRLPIRAGWNDTLLRERIEADWHPQDDAGRI